MQLIVNGEPQRCEAETLARLLERLDYRGDFLATAVNGDLVPAAQRASWPLQEGDRIEILAPMQGG